MEVGDVRCGLDLKEGGAFSTFQVLVPAGRLGNSAKYITSSL